MNAISMALVKALRDGMPIPPDVFDDDEIEAARTALSQEAREREMGFERLSCLPADIGICRTCGTYLPADHERSRILGKDVGDTCNKCLPALRRKVIREQLESANVPELFLREVTSEGDSYSLPSGKWWTVIMGATGTGKTHRACQLIVGSWKARFVSWPRLLLDRKSFFNGKLPADPLDEVMTFRGALIVDDFGAGKVGDHARETAEAVLGFRYDEKLRCIITTNLDLPKIADELSFGDRLASRFSGAGHLTCLANRQDLRQLPPKERASAVALAVAKIRAASGNRNAHASRKADA